MLNVISIKHRCVQFITIYICPSVKIAKTWTPHHIIFSCKERPKARDRILLRERELMKRSDTLGVGFQ